jgi:hypothetical protein
LGPCQAVYRLHALDRKRQSVKPMITHFATTPDR